MGHIRDKMKLCSLQWIPAEWEVRMLITLHIEEIALCPVLHQYHGCKAPRHTTPALIPVLTPLFSEQLQGNCGKVK